jgi:hypothetical protein
MDSLPGKLTCSRRQDEDKLLAVFRIEVIDACFSVFVRSVTIDTTVLVAAHHQEIFHDCCRERG